ncbi:hypothetical protein [Frankia sp. Cr2]|uniref:hypothetical protein n=1 Tax=Frankia sp. Cr2 TaxID=3073932 RepID=UPI002AD2B5E2|nr:hypothetical protein [Frankia sp. Cr2]
MLIDCDTCVVRGDACGDCVLHVLLTPEPVADWDEAEQRALAALAAAGLLPQMTPWPRPVPVALPPAVLPPAVLPAVALVPVGSGSSRPSSSSSQRSRGRARRAG